MPESVARRTNRVTTLGIAALVASALCWVAETVLYGGRIDAHGVLQESFFLPLTFILAALGIALVAVGALRGRG